MAEGPSRPSLGGGGGATDPRRTRSASPKAGSVGRNRLRAAVSPEVSPTPRSLRLVSARLAAVMPAREHPTKQTRHRSLAPAVRRAPALNRTHAFDEATDDGEQEVDRTGTTRIRGTRSPAETRELRVKWSAGLGARGSRGGCPRRHP